MFRPAPLTMAVALLASIGCGGATHSSVDAPPAVADASASDLDAAPDVSSVPDATAAPDVPSVPDAAAAADVSLLPDVAAAPDVAPDLPPAPQPYARPTYTKLSETGLYSDLAARSPAAGVTSFSPNNVLWADGADKQRWIRLPPGTQIDTSNMDHWVFPVGTKAWKEFSIGGVLLETRLIERYGTGPQDFWMGAFVWSQDQSDATFEESGQADINGTQHDAPAQRLCTECHNGEPGRILGFSAMQLSRAGQGITLDYLGTAGWVSHPAPAGAPFHPPGDATTAAALGYLHANCGHCHNTYGTAWPDTQMVLRLGTAETAIDATSTDLFKSVIGQPLESFKHAGFSERVVPGDPAASAVVFRMQSRGGHDQMPPIATEIADPTGVGVVTAWISSLPLPDGGAPAGPPDGGASDGPAATADGGASDLTAD